MPQFAQLRADLVTVFHAGLARVEGRSAVAAALQGAQEACSVIAIGKAAQAMVLGAADVLGERLLDGLVISKPGHMDPALLSTLRLQSLEGGHPVPDLKSLEAGQAMIDYITALPADRPLLFLISGGASGLVDLLQDGVDLDLLQRVNRWLLGNGLDIKSMNRVRKALSKIKGGGLLAYLGNRPTRALLISDVQHDDPAVIGSGLLVPDGPNQNELTDLNLPDWIGQPLSGCQARPFSSERVSLQIVASLRDAREAAATKARELGYSVYLSHAHLGADAATTGERLALELMDAWPGIYIWGGEPTVMLPENPGRGGRNQHLALSASLVLAGSNSACLLSAGTDGGDGPGEDAGAIVDGLTLTRGARRAGLDAEKSLQAADAGSFLEASGDLIQTGPTGTNVMDLVIGLKI